MRLGARSLKTGLAVTIALLIATALHLTPPTMAGIGAAVATQPSVQQSVRSMFDNIQGNLLGAIVAVLFVYFIGTSPIIIGLAVIIVIAIMLKLKLQTTITLTMVTAIVIMVSDTPSNQHFILYSLDRVILVIIGVLSATIVNLVFLPPKYENRFYYNILNQTTELFKWVRLLSQQASENTKIKSELNQFDDTKVKIFNFYQWYKEERAYTRKQRFAKYRISVIFKHMMATTNRLHDILKSLDRNENDYNQLPEDFKITLRKQLDGLMSYHERVLLKFNGKIKRQHHREQMKENFRHKTKIAESFISYYGNDEVNKEEWLNLFPLISLIVDYSQNIEHLDLLIESFQTYHKKENKIKLKPDDFDSL
ncbi:FUSC family protein [Terrilactibacillus laevilacticus]|uniref:Aromatic acid exporter family protein n=1 Tax=Terrilactibacillus laevilacticus TaxID=1380157 RepID=A0ABW5PUW2_9BACI|nr:aromatic acid exporter family protein [Terrilactibacillus laevilacticus]